MPEQVSGLVLCRGDTNSSACSSCLSQAFQDVLQLCPYNKAAALWDNDCMVRFSNQHFLSNPTDNSLQAAAYAVANVTSDPARFDELVNNLMTATSDWASYNSTRHFATAETTNVLASPQYPNLYGLAQCTPNLSGSQCQICLQGLTNQISPQFDGKIGARILGTWCNVRYESAPFYSGAVMVRFDAASPAPAPAPMGAVGPTVTPEIDQGKKKKNSTATILAIIIPIIAVASVSLTVAYFCVWKKRKTTRKTVISGENNLEGGTSVDSLLLDLSTLRTATNNFADFNKLGEGGFGSVYKGTLPNGEEIAVKRLSQSSDQGFGELKNELVLVAKLQHKNLARLLGVCLEEQEKLLVYEYVPNRSLDTFLFDIEKRAQLNWRKRCRVIDGVARGLQYLHEDSLLKIVHRDLKASNVLLDLEMNPKISDFGLARLFGGDKTVDITKHVVGTLGYMPPEYAIHGRYSIKSDVFSFGILVLEIVTGRRNNGSFDSEQAEYLLSFVWERWNMGTITEITDPLLGQNCPRWDIIRYINIGLLCVQEDPTERPKMSEVVVMLSSNTVSLQSPSRPAFVISRNSGVNSDEYSSSIRGRSSGRLVPVSQNEVTITDLEAR